MTIIGVGILPMLAACGTDDASSLTQGQTGALLVNGNVVIQYANVFHADQSNVANYKASDVLWAQTVMQTGTDEVHLSFQHVMSALTLTMGSGVNLSKDAVVTLVGMPDIDEAEIIVGDKYAKYSKVNSTCGYKSMNSTGTDEDNGKVLGIGVNDDSAGTASCQAISGIAQTATYKAYRNSDGAYQLILPPCILTEMAVIWVRDGESRWSVPLSQQTFEQGTMYNITLNPPTSTRTEEEKTE